MIKVFRVYENSSLIGSYLNKWASDNDSGVLDLVPIVDSLVNYNEVVELESNISASENEFAYRFRVDDKEFMFWAKYIVEQKGKNLEVCVQDTCKDIEKYIRLNFRDEIESGNMTRLITVFLANYFKKYEDVIKKQKRIDSLKRGLQDVQVVTSQVFANIVERGRSINDLQADVSTISDHGHIFHRKSKRLKRKMILGRLKVYVWGIVSLFTLYLILRFVH